jgi:hypothetical protein
VMDCLPTCDNACLENLFQQKRQSRDQHPTFSHANRAPAEADAPWGSRLEYNEPKLPIILRTIAGDRPASVLATVVCWDMSALKETPARGARSEPWSAALYSSYPCGENHEGGSHGGAFANWKFVKGPPWPPHGQPPKARIVSAKH